ncbi:MAG: DUF4386 domain-containing protein [Gammaproteobacteria bacterium]|nr:DUF4386 domain-containing protein [Gammaproteobacteria bacterium]
MKVIGETSMSTAVMTERTADASPRTRARISGVVYLLFFLTAVLGALFTPGTSGLGGVSSDAAATAHTILAHEPSFRLGWALGLISTACYVALMALFYQLFRPVSRSLSVLAAFFGLVGCAVTAFQSLFQLAPLVLLGGAPYLKVFNVKQLQALALLVLNLNVQAGYIALVFFGVFQLLIGYLIFRSTFLPRILGALIACAGLGWLTFLSPPLANHLLTYLEVLGFLGEVPLMLWLLVIGVNAQRWTEQASAGRASIRTSKPPSTQLWAPAT